MELKTKPMRQHNSDLNIPVYGKYGKLIAWVPGIVINMTTGAKYIYQVSLKTHKSVS